MTVYARRHLPRRAGLVAAALLCVAASAARADEPGALATELAVGDVAALPWRTSAVYSHSTLSGGRPDWDQVVARLQRTVTPTLFVAGFVDAQRRPPDTNTGYGADASWYPVPTLEWRGAMMFVPAATFLAQQTYGTGLEWRASPAYSVAGDYKRQNFGEGPIDQVSPAVTLWFDDDRTWFTARYVYGRAFEAQNFHAFSLRLALGVRDSDRLTMIYARGADPEKDPGVPGVILTNATNFAAFYRLKLGRGFNLIVGADREDRPGYYTKTTGTIGFDGAF
jgi:YaiO family outer membrane protein